jgi:hypothetical protein
MIRTYRHMCLCTLYMHQHNQVLRCAACCTLCVRFGMLLTDGLFKLHLLHWLWVLVQLPLPSLLPPLPLMHTQALGFLLQLRATRRALDAARLAAFTAALPLSLPATPHPILHCLP